MTFYCAVDEVDTKFTGTLEYDGYLVGDRLLDGVVFLADVKDGKLIDKSIRVRKDCAEYFKGLNRRKWVRAALKGIKDHDLFPLHSSPLKVETFDGDDIWKVFE